MRERMCSSWVCRCL